MFCGVRATRSSVFCAVFCRSLLVLLSFALSIITFMALDYPPLVSSNFSDNMLIYFRADYPELPKHLHVKLMMTYGIFKICLYVV